MISKKSLGISAIGSVIAISAIAILTSITTISPGYAGVIYNRNGGVEQKAIPQGWHFVSPLKKVIHYPVSTETAYYNHSDEEGRDSDDTLILGTKDGKTIRVDLQLFYHMDIDKLGNVFSKFRGQDSETIAYGYMRQNAQRIANDISSKYSIVDLVGEAKPKFNSEVLSELQAFFGEDGIVIEQAGLGRIEPDEETKTQIQAVTDAQYRQKQAEYEKEVAIAKAAALREEARGKADAMKIDADAQFYYNTKIAESTNAQVIQLEQIKKWDGKFPQYMLGSNSNMLFNLK